MPRGHQVYHKARTSWQFVWILFWFGHGFIVTFAVVAHEVRRQARAESPSFIVAVAVVCQAAEVRRYARALHRKSRARPTAPAFTQESSS